MDETQPLLQDANLVYDERPDDAPNKDIVDFNPDGDEENPLEWPTAYKWGMVSLLAFMAFTVYVSPHSTTPSHN